MADPVKLEHSGSPTHHEIPTAEPSSIPPTSPLQKGPGVTSPSTGAAAAVTGTNNDLLHPSFLPPCEHGRDGDMHAHAFDLLSLSGGPPVPIKAGSPTPSEAVPASVPTQPMSILSASRPVQPNGLLSPPLNGVAAGSAPRPRRMSSSTTGALGRGKLGLVGDGLGLGGVAKDPRPAAVGHAVSYSVSSPIPNRRPVAQPAATGSPQLFDFTKTDRRPSHSHARPAIARPTGRSTSTSIIPASLPAHNNLAGRGRILPALAAEEMELDMDFDGEDADEEEGGSGSSAELEMEMDMDMDEDDGEIKPEWNKLALGTGSGGLKGRRKGMVFKCESCLKEYRHPSCLIKHRWEHSPHWKEPTQLSMSKHQQVQMLEAAAILAHLDPTAKALPSDKSLWPAMLSPLSKEIMLPSRGPRDPAIMSPQSSAAAPLTPSSFRDLSTLSSGGPRTTKDRKSSPGSDSTTSSVGEALVPGSLGLREGGLPLRAPITRPVGIEVSGHASSVSSVPGPGTPHSIGSLPDMARLAFQPAQPPLSTGGVGVSPIPNRGTPLSLQNRTGMIGKGMFGAVNTRRPSSGIRSGAVEDEDEDGGEDGLIGLSGKKSSSEEAEDRRKLRAGEEWGMAMDMEL